MPVRLGQIVELYRQARCRSSWRVDELPPSSQDRLDLHAVQKRKLGRCQGSCKMITFMVLQRDRGSVDTQTAQPSQRASEQL